MAQAQIAPLAKELETALNQAVIDDTQILLSLRDDLESLTLTRMYRERRGTSPSAVAMLTRRKASASARVRRKAAKLKQEMTKLDKQVKEQPKYKNAVFSCINDYDKCRRNRGPYSTLCAIAFILCMTKHALPALKAAGKAAGGAITGSTLT